MSSATKITLPDGFFHNIKDSGATSYADFGLDESNKHIINAHVVIKILPEINPIALKEADFVEKASLKIDTVFDAIMGELTAATVRYKDAVFYAGLVLSMRTKIENALTHGNLTPRELTEAENKTIMLVYAFLQPGKAFPDGFEAIKSRHVGVFDASIRENVVDVDVKLQAALDKKLSKAKTLETEIRDLYTQAYRLEYTFSGIEDNLKILLGRSSSDAADEHYMTAARSNKQVNFYRKVEAKKAELAALKEDLLVDYLGNEAKLLEVGAINIPSIAEPVIFRSYDTLKAHIHEFASLSRGHLYLPQLIEEIEAQGNLAALSSECGVSEVDLKASPIPEATITALKTTLKPKPTLSLLGITLW